MKIKSILRHAIFIAGISLVSAFAQADDTSFKKDRAAILSMAGKFEVTFNFHETYSTSEEYTIKEKKYREQAHELVKVVQDTDRRIVLQHLLLVDDGTEIMVIKHWGQVWTFEDKDILEYQNNTTWKKKTLSSEATRGTWSQYVTQTDDSPRYESNGHWQHDRGISQWISAHTPRPLPRREYTKRKDYDLIIGANTHTITPNGWIHEQSNRKLIKRDGIEKFLCQERGFNTYIRVPEHDFSVAETYWKKHSLFWQSIRAHWTDHIAKSDSVSYTRKIDGVSMSKAVRRLMADVDENKPAKPEAIAATLSPYLK